MFFIHKKDTKSFDGWQLKKSILNTLFQAVKAITGGVTTLKVNIKRIEDYLHCKKIIGYIFIEILQTVIDQKYILLIKIY